MSWAMGEQNQVGVTQKCCPKKSQAPAQHDRCMIECVSPFCSHAEPFSASVGWGIQPSALERDNYYDTCNTRLEILLAWILLHADCRYFSFI